MSNAASLLDFISPQEAAAMLGVKLITLQNWRAKGRGPAFHKRGHTARARVLYTKQEVAEFLASQMVRHVPTVDEDVRESHVGL